MNENDIKNEALKISPVVGANVSTYLGFTLSDWMYITTIVYMLLQIGWVLLKMYLKVRERSRHD